MIIAGSRGFENYELLFERCEFYFSRKRPDAIISGMARGADALGARYANENGIALLEMPADRGMGKMAGYRRNCQMAEEGDVLIAFWDGLSKGTKHMVDMMVGHGKPTRVIFFDNYSQKMIKTLAYN